MPPIDAVRAALSAGLPGEISVQEDRKSSEYIIGTEIAGEEKLEQTREPSSPSCATIRDLGGKLDLNNSSGALTARLGDPDLAARILAYRDRERGGAIRSLDELRRPGVDADPRDSQTGLRRVHLPSGSSAMVGPRAGEELRQRARSRPSARSGHADLHRLPLPVDLGRRRGPRDTPRRRHHARPVLPHRTGRST